MNVQILRNTLYLKQHKINNGLILSFSDELFQDIATDYVKSGMPNGTHTMLLLPTFSLL